MGLRQRLRAEREGLRRLHPDAGPRELALGLAAWGVNLAWGVPSLSALTLLAGPLGVRPERLQPLYRLYSAVQLRLLGVRWRAEVDAGVEPGRAYFFLQNHVNHFDFIACHNASPHFRQGIELESHFRVPLYGPFMRSRGTVPVRAGERGQSGALTERIRAELARSRSILGFPEGTRTLDGRVGPFRKGLFRIARDLGAPIVPVAVAGLYEVMRKGSSLLRPGADVRVSLGAPVPTQDLPDEALDGLVAQVRGFIAARVDPRYPPRTPSPEGLQ
jgi:1-acyl-sn-glycerol-3-phosphate acyltransferase